MQTTNGTLAKVTKNTLMYNTGWGPIYVPKTVVTAEGLEETDINVTFTFSKSDA
jgi:hypothetical protein